MDENTRQKIIETYLEEHSIARTAKRLGISGRKVSAVLHDADVPLFHTGNKGHHVDHQEVLRLWNETHVTRVIAEKLGISQAHVGNILKNDFGISLPKYRPNKYDLPMDEIIARYKAGENCREIGESFGVPDERIRRRLKVAGVPRRNKYEHLEAHGKDNVFYKDGKKRPDVHYFRRQSYEVAAICLGQPVPQGWIIHHIDENPHNNNPDNILLFHSAREHSKYHVRLLRRLSTGVQVDSIQFALENGAEKLPQPPHPILLPPYKGQRDPSKTPDSQEQSQKKSIRTPACNARQLELLPQ